jgi:hypothetical protein
MAYAAEQLLEHDNLGVGKVLDVQGDRITIHFKKDGVSRKLSANRSPLKPSKDQHDPYFDGIKASAASRMRRPAINPKARRLRTKAAGAYATHQEAVDGFLKIYPLGFNDPKYLADDGERGQKTTAHQLWNESLNQQEFQQFMADGNYQEVVKRAKQVESSSNLLHPQFERAVLWGAISDPEAAKFFSLRLFDLIYGEDSFEARFNRHITIDELPKDKSSMLKWPALTIFPFLARPSQHLFMKPEVTKAAAKRLAFALNYKTTPNWQTYSCLLEFGALLKKELADLGPRDMIDVQSFISATGSQIIPKESKEVRESREDPSL